MFVAFVPFEPDNVLGKVEIGPSQRHDLDRPGAGREQHAQDREGQGAVGIVADQLDQRLVELRQFGRFEVVRDLPATASRRCRCGARGDSAGGGKAQQRFQQREGMAAGTFGGPSNGVTPTAPRFRRSLRPLNRGCTM